MKEVQFTLWGIPEDCRADEFAKFMSVYFQLHLNAVVRIDAFASCLQRYEKML